MYISALDLFAHKSDRIVIGGIKSRRNIKGEYFKSSSKKFVKTISKISICKTLNGEATMR